MKSGWTGLVLAGLVATAGTAPAADDLVQRVKNADLVIFGEVMNIARGDLDEAALKRGIKRRTDTAGIAVAEVLKGAAAARKVRVRFQAFPGDDGLKIEPDQRGIWLLTKAGPKIYEATAKTRFLPAGRLAAVRRAVRAAGELAPADPGTDDWATTVGGLRKQLRDKLPGRRSLAAHRLGHMGAMDAVPDLIRALDDSAASVRLAADIALRKITGHRVELDFRDAGPAVRAPGIQAWKTWWAARANEEAALPALVKQLESDDEVARLSADMALRGLTGHRVDVDFTDGPPSARAAGVAAWKRWLAARPHETRRRLLATAVRARLRPQPEYKYGIEGLADVAGPATSELFHQALAEGVDLRRTDLIIAAAGYFGRVRDRSAVPGLAALVDGSVRWQPSRPTRQAVVTAIGLIVGKDFGTGRAGLEKCAAWWRDHAEEFE